MHFNSMPLFVCNQIVYNTDNPFLMLWRPPIGARLVFSSTFYYLSLPFTFSSLFNHSWGICFRWSHSLHFLVYSLVICFVQCSVPFSTAWMRGWCSLESDRVYSFCLNKESWSEQEPKATVLIYLACGFVRYLQSFNDTKLLDWYF